MSFPQFVANSAQFRYLKGMKPGGMGLFVAGVGIGKTTLMDEVACILAAYNPHTVGLIVSHVLLHARNVHLPALVARLKEYRNFSHIVKQDRQIHCRNGAIIQYGSADRPDSLDGYDAGWCLMDEIRYWREDAHDKAISRVRDNNAAFPFTGFFTTPEMNWMYDRYHDLDAPGYYCVRGATSENLHNLQPGYFERLRRTMDPRTFRQYVEGHWGLVEGAVFPDFDMELHVGELLRDPDLPMHLMVDFGIRAPAALFFQHHKWCNQHQVGDCIHVLDELMLDNHYTEILAIEIARLYQARRWPKGTAFVDPAGANRSQETGLPSVAYIEGAGFPCEWTSMPSSRSIPNGIAVINSKVRNVDGKTSLYFSRKMQGEGHERGIIKAMGRCEYPPRKPGQGMKDEPIKSEYTHALDALRYGMVNLFPPAAAGVSIY